MILTGKEYLESIRDGRVVYVGGERISDTTTHPAFANAARTYARLYDLKADPGEQVNVAADHPADVARLLTQLLQTYGERAAAMSGGGGDAMTAEQIEQMKAKGYWGFIDPASSTGPAGK